MFSHEEVSVSKLVRRAALRLIPAAVIALFLCALLSARSAHPGAERLLEALILVVRFEVPHTLPILLCALLAAGLYVLLFQTIQGVWRRWALRLCLMLPCLLELLLHSVW